MYHLNSAYEKTNSGKKSFEGIPFKVIFIADEFVNKQPFLKKNIDAIHATNNDVYEQHLNKIECMYIEFLKLEFYLIS